MNRIAAIVITCLGVTTAYLLYLRIAERVPTASISREAEVIERLDRLEKSIAQLAATRRNAHWRAIGNRFRDARGLRGQRPHGGG